MGRFSLSLSPRDFELAVTDVLRAAGAELTDFTVLSLERLSG